MTDERRPRFDALFTACYEPVLAYALRRAEPEVAEDVVAETFVTAWRRLDQIPPDALPWLYSVARRVLANQRRSGARRKALVSRLAAEMRAEVRSWPDPGDEIHERRSMHEALDRLSDEDREILMLVAWEGLTPERAAEVMGLSPGTFSVRLHRARQRLARELERLEGKRHAEDEAGGEGDRP